MLQLIRLIAIGGVLFSIYLVGSDLYYGNFCPKLIFLPACYPVLLSFLMVLGATCFKRINTLLYSGGTLMGILLAIYFSYNQMKGLKECPKLFQFPLCYLSFMVFLLFIPLFFLHRKKL